MKNLLMLLLLIILSISCNSRKNHENKEEFELQANLAFIPPPPVENEISMLKNEERVSTSEPFDKNQKLIKEGNIKF
ncbi:hypothetical protein EGI22_13390 [Lacihabitans sp. LS3-19]|uniref:hypothetical protein n=1 Tax=Lacihabitans sp. LS3-19 TaxID=2487335 RepID=UPI0020CB76FF|nr:hypothetical protein [Lacihabitans sp. LS3-19]MCP9768907.1 hypothetical protein [Lacihabitans sp. LS3-19]